MGLGRQVSYGIGKETTPGTPVSATDWLKQLSFELNPMSETSPNTSALGVVEKTNSSTVLRRHTEGSFEAKLTDNTGGLILLGAMGSVSTAPNADGSGLVYDHTFNINQNINGQSFTLVRKDEVGTRRHSLARFGEWSLTMELDNYIRYTAAILAKKAESTTASPAYTEENEFVPKHMNIRSAATAAGLGAASDIATVESFTLTCNPNLEADWQSGSGDPYGFSSRGYDLTFEITKRYVNSTYEDAYNAGTELAWRVTTENTDVTLGTAARPKLVFTAPKVNITDYARSEDVDAPVTETFTGTIHFSVSDAYALRAVLTNLRTSY